jgi:hypothetical protein
MNWKMNSPLHTAANYGGVSSATAHTPTKGITAAIAAFKNGLVAMTGVFIVLGSAFGGESHDAAYIKALPKGATPDTVTTRGFYAKWCADYAAWLIERDGVAFTNQWKVSRWGNPDTWDDAAKLAGMLDLPSGARAYGANGIVIRSTAETNDIALWPAKSTLKEGHVGKVLSQDSKNWLVRDYNWFSKSAPNQLAEHDVLKSSDWRPTNFLSINPGSGGGKLSIKASSSDFGKIKVGKAADDITVTIKNEGKRPLKLTACDQTGDPPTLGRANNLAGTTLQPGKSAKLIIAFVPKAKKTYRSTFTIASDGGVEKVSISGTGK